MPASNWYVTNDQSSLRSLHDHCMLLQASVFNLYDLLSLCTDQLSATSAARSASARYPGPQDPSKPRSGSPNASQLETEILATCARTLASVACGSSAHLDLAMEWMIRTESKFGPDHQEAKDAARMCKAAHVARYGQMRDRLLRLLMDARAGLGVTEE